MCIDWWLPCAIVKLYICIYCWLIALRVNWNVCVEVSCVQCASVSVSAVKFDVWRHNSSPRPVRTVRPSASTVARSLIHEVSQLIVPRHLFSHARLSSCPARCARCGPGPFIHKSDQLFSCTTRVSIVALLPGFLLCLSFCSELKCFHCRYRFASGRSWRQAADDVAIWPIGPLYFALL